jgi:hypothetical protein
MATWKDVEKYIRSEYKILPDSPKGMIAIDFNLNDGRSQKVFLSRGGNDAMGEAVHILSIIGKLSPSKIAEACKEVTDMVVGGIVLFDDLVMLRHSVLLENVDENELVKPLLAVTIGADRLEQKLTGSDRA